MAPQASHLGDAKTYTQQPASELKVTVGAQTEQLDENCSTKSTKPNSNLSGRSQRVIRIGKYLVTKEAFVFSSYGYPAPKAIANLEELEQDTARVSVRSGPVETPSALSEFQVFSDKGQESRTLPQLPAAQNRVHVIRGGASVGRNCCLLGPDDQIIAETGFYLDANALARTLTLGRLHPHYWRYRWQGDLRSRWSLPKRQFLSGSIAPINNRCSHNYYHWLIEVAPRIVAMQLVGLQPDWYLVDCHSRFQRQVLEILGIPLERIIQPHCTLHLAADEIFFVKEVSSETLCQFGAAIRHRLQLPSQPTGRKLYISRRQARHRKVENEPEVEQYLQRRGFDCVCFEDLSCKEQFRMVSESEIILTTHGAALANSIFASPGTKIIELFPQHRLNIDLYPNLSRICKLQHSTLLIKSTRFLQQIRVEIPDLERLLCALETTSEQPGFNSPQLFAA